MHNNARIIEHAHHVNYQCQYGKLINPISRIHSTDINHQLHIDKPQTDSFRQNQNSNSDNRMNVYGGAKDMIQSFSYHHIPVRKR